MDGWISPFKRTCAYVSSTCPVVLDCAGLRPVYQPSAGRTDSCPQKVTSSPYLPCTYRSTGDRATTPHPPRDPGTTEGAHTRIALWELGCDLATARCRSPTNTCDLL